ncbi:MAG: polynucleotide adenylyltransferase PcnB [Spirochaetaceae bacterium]|jgi:poly(A) polymerase|nr:polynucleotide adenylyltransferase PcnB [Spirochaetaceae bacterium]
MRVRYSADENGRRRKKALVYTREEHGINLSDVDRDAVFIIERLRAAGFETYIVGGAVRDLLLGQAPKDFDIVSEASPPRIKKVFRNSRIIGRRFRLVHVYFGPKIFEVSTFRSLKDGTTSNTFGTIEEDVRRRDFSLNALFYDPLREEVVDYVDGLKDIRERRIRPLISPALIFRDDPVRMIRAVKYAAATGFGLPLTLRLRIRRESSLLADISASRLTEEIMKIIKAPRAAAIVELLEAQRLYSYLQPNAARLMREGSFRERYLQGFRALSEPGAGGELPGRNMAALIRDYLEDNIDWTAGTHENYAAAYYAARKFVLPMNPPRTELDQAVRLIFGEHGITLKKARFLERGSGGFGPRMPREGAVPEKAGEAPPPKRRRVRRRHGKSAAPAEGLDAPGGRLAGDGEGV